MKEFDEATIKNLILLSRIECSDEEKKSLLKDLKEIIVYFEQLNEIPTEDISPCNHVLAEMTNVTREDVIGPTLSREALFANAPSQIGGMFKIPTVIKQNS